MADNVTTFPTRDLVVEMAGPVNQGCAVRIEGRIVPNMVMFDHGDIVEFVLDHRLGFGFPRAQAYDAAAFAAAAMAIGAGFSHPSGMHFTQRPFAPPSVNLGTLPEPEKSNP